MKYTITGATGHLGRKVVEQLSRLVDIQDIRLAVHTPSKAQAFLDQGYEVVKSDYYDVESMTKAFADTDVLIYIPSITYDVANRVLEFENSLKAMQKADVKNLVDVSFIADQPNNPFQMAGYYAYLPARLAGTKLNYAVIKNSLYADPLVPYLPELIERRNIIYPVGDQAMSFITRDDSAEAIANVAVKPYLRDYRQIYLLTQKQNYNMIELSRIMSEATGQEIGYAPVSLPEFADIYRAEGDGDELASMYHAAAMGLMDAVTDDFQHITGHEPMPMDQFLRQNYQR